MATAPTLPRSAPTGVVCGLLDELSGVLERLEGVDLAVLPTSDLAAAVVGFQRLSDRCTAGVARFVAAGDEARVWVGSGNRGMAGWLAEQSHVGFGRASELSKLGEVLGANDTVARKVRDGELSTATVTALASTLLAPPSGVDGEDVEVLLDACTNTDPRQARTAVEAWKAAHETVDEVELARRRFARRALRFGVPVDGMIQISGSLPSFDANQVRKTLTAWGGGRPRHGDDRTPAQRVADGLLALTRQAALHPNSLTPPDPGPAVRTGSDSTAPASVGDEPAGLGLFDLDQPDDGPPAGRYDTGADDDGSDPGPPDDGPPRGGTPRGGPPRGGPGGGPPGGGPPRHGPPGGGATGNGRDRHATTGEGSAGDGFRPAGGRQGARLVVLVPVGVLDGGPGNGWDEYDCPIPGSVVRGIADHALAGDVETVVHDGAVVHAVGSSTRLGLGRTTRAITRAIYMALLARDGHCRWPGCTRPAAWCEIDHRIPWESGGCTDLENLWLLCKEHHREKHRAGVVCTVGPAGTNGTVRIHLPNGTVQHSPPDGPITRGSGDRYPTSAGASARHWSTGSDIGSLVNTWTQT